MVACPQELLIVLHVLHVREVHLLHALLHLIVNHAGAMVGLVRILMARCALEAHHVTAFYVVLGLVIRVEVFVVDRIIHKFL